MMIGGRRSCGKTTELIKKSSAEHLHIICADRQRLRVITKIAADMKLDIPYPITAEELPSRSSFIKGVLVDDTEEVLCNLIRKPVLMASTSLEMKELQLSSSKKYAEERRKTVEIQEAQKVIHAGLAWADWTDEQKSAMRIALTCMIKLGQINEEASELWSEEINLADFGERVMNII